MDDKERTNDRRKAKPPISQDTTKYDGVYYTPSRKKDDKEAPVRMSPTRPIPSPYSKGPKSGKPGGPKKQKSQFAIFFITTIFVGVIVCVIAVALGLNYIQKDRNESNLAISSPSPPVDSSEDAGDGAIENEIVAVITNIQTANKKLSFYDLENNKTYSVFIDKDTILNDKYGNSMVFAEIKEGEVVEAIFADADNSTLKKIQTSSHAWEMVSNAKINTENKTITISNISYKYTDNIIAVDKGNFFDISTLDPVDIITARGYKDTAWYISLEKGHGVLEIENRKDIVNASLEIDTTIFERLDESKRINLTQGSHHVVIKGDNIDPLTKEINILAGQTTALELSEIQLKEGALTITVTEPNAIVTIDDEEISYREPLVLDYGEYEVKASKEGFADVTKKIIINSDTHALELTLEKIVYVTEITINTIPQGADIYVDNIHIGISPVSTSLEYGLKTITAKMDGYHTSKFPTTITKDNPPLDISLIPLEERTNTDTSEE